MPRLIPAVARNHRRTRKGGLPEYRQFLPSASNRRGEKVSALTSHAQKDRASFAERSFVPHITTIELLQNANAGRFLPAFLTPVNSYSSASNKNLRIYRRVDSETSGKGRLTVRAAGGPCTRSTSYYPPHRFFGRSLQQIWTRTGGARQELSPRLQKPQSEA